MSDKIETLAARILSLNADELRELMNLLGWDEGGPGVREPRNPHDPQNPQAVALELPPQ